MDTVDTQPRLVGRERELRASRRPWRRILLATDGSHSSLVAAERALELARRDSAELSVLVVRPASDDGALRAAGDGPLPGPVSDLVARARAAGVSARSRVRVGEPALVILGAAAEIDADVIVVGRRGWPFAEGPGRMVTGYLLRHSDRPVLVVAPWAQLAANDSPERHTRRSVRRIAMPSSIDDSARLRVCLPVTDGRVACPRLGEVSIEGCLECSWLLHFEPGKPGVVVCSVADPQSTR